jgi:hypothetical protein
MSGIFANANFDQVAPTQLAVDRKVKERPITQPALAIEPKPDRPNLWCCKRPFCAELASFIPWAPLSEGSLIL